MQQINTDGGVVGDLLHCLSQPLTTLHCALENSLAQEVGDSSEQIQLALSQTDRIIEGVRLLREYLTPEPENPASAGSCIEPVFDEVLSLYSPLAEVRGVRLLAIGHTHAVARVRPARLQRSLLYLVETLLESAQKGDAVVVVLEDRASHSILSAHIVSMGPTNPRLPKHGTPRNTLRQARLAIAQRVFESCGAALEFHSEEKPGFTIKTRPGPALPPKQSSPRRGACLG